MEQTEKMEQILKRKHIPNYGANFKNGADSKIGAKSKNGANFQNGANS